MTRDSQQEETPTMDSLNFDTMAKSLGERVDRRGAVRGMVAGALAAVVGAGVLRGEADARRRRRRKGKKGATQNPGSKLQPGQPCQATAQCASGYLCAVPVNGSNSDLYCSGGQGAICGAPNGDGDDTSPFCAVGFRCEPSGGQYRCNAVPDDI
jgi:hypothetical protein